jgi:hypothetical protein
LHSSTASAIDATAAIDLSNHPDSRIVREWRHFFGSIGVSPAGSDDFGLRLNPLAPSQWRSSPPVDRWHALISARLPLYTLDRSVFTALYKACSVEVPPAIATTEKADVPQVHSEAKDEADSASALSALSCSTTKSARSKGSTYTATEEGCDAILKATIKLQCEWQRPATDCFGMSVYTPPSEDWCQLNLHNRQFIKNRLPIGQALLVGYTFAQLRDAVCKKKDDENLTLDALLSAANNLLATHWEELIYHRIMAKTYTKHLYPSSSNPPKLGPECFFPRQQTNYTTAAALLYTDPEGKPLAALRATLARQAAAYYKKRKALRRPEDGSPSLGLPARQLGGPSAAGASAVVNGSGGLSPSGAAVAAAADKGPSALSASRASGTSAAAAAAATNGVPQGLRSEPSILLRMRSGSKRHRSESVDTQPPPPQRARPAATIASPPAAAAPSAAPSRSTGVIAATTSPPAAAPSTAASTGVSVASSLAAPEPPPQFLAAVSRMSEKEKKELVRVLAAQMPGGRDDD